MEITYISHSGFLIEWESCYFLFDYYKGDIPKMDADKKVFVFVSHKHHDHFNPSIFELEVQYPNIEFILSSDIDLIKMEDEYIIVRPSNTYELMDSSHNKILLTTLESTDSGVAFLLKYLGKTIYYAGDLNWWYWIGESKEYNDTMTAMFNKEMRSLKDVPIDLAFAPLDPRQEGYYYLGLVELLNTASVNYVFPMHFWGKPSIIQRFKEERESDLNHTKIMDVHHEGQTWKIEI